MDSRLPVCLRMKIITKNGWCRLSAVDTICLYIIDMLSTTEGRQHKGFSIFPYSQTDCFAGMTTVDAPFFSRTAISEEKFQFSFRSAYILSPS